MISHIHISENEITFFLAPVRKLSSLIFTFFIFRSPHLISYHLLGLLPPQISPQSCYHCRIPFFQLLMCVPGGRSRHCYLRFTNEEAEAQILTQRVKSQHRSQALKCEVAFQACGLEFLKYRNHIRQLSKNPRSASIGTVLPKGSIQRENFQHKIDN